MSDGRWLDAAIPVLMLAACIEAAPASPPAIERTLDTRPDQGNHERSAYVTGPTTPVARLYNHDAEIAFWNQPHALTFSFAKNDVWDRRYFGDGKKPITLADVRRVCFGGKASRWRSSDLGLPDAPHALYHAYDFPCPKPVGQAIIRCPDLRGHAHYSAGQASDGMVVAKADKGEARQTARSRAVETMMLRLRRTRPRSQPRPRRSVSRRRRMRRSYEPPFG